MLLGGVLVCAGIATYTVITAPAPSISVPKVDTKEKVITSQPSSDMIIYRWPDRGTYNVSYTPSDRDLLFPNSGLSFSTIPKAGSVQTTIEELNSTGVVYAVQDGATHVSVYPIGTTLTGWHDAGPNSPWSKAVQSACIEWDVN